MTVYERLRAFAQLAQASDAQLDAIISAMTDTAAFEALTREQIAALIQPDPSCTQERIFALQAADRVLAGYTARATADAKTIDTLTEALRRLRFAVGYRDAALVGDDRAHIKNAARLMQAAIEGADAALSHLKERTDGL